MTTSDYPARLTIDHQESLSRVTTIFRLILIIPIAIVFGILTRSNQTVILQESESGQIVDRTLDTGFGIIGTLFVVTLLLILFRKRYPRWWFDFNLGLHRFMFRVSSYLLLLTDRYPSTEDEQNVHLDLNYPDAQADLKRGMPLVKWFLAIPHYVVLFFLWMAALIVTFVAWFAIVFTGRYPRGMFDFVVGVMRWSWRVEAYAILLATDKYPPFSLE